MSDQLRTLVADLSPRAPGGAAIAARPASTTSSISESDDEELTTLATRTSEATDDEDLRPFLPLPDKVRKLLKEKEVQDVQEKKTKWEKVKQADKKYTLDRDTLLQHILEYWEKHKKGVYTSMGMSILLVCLNVATVFTNVKRQYDEGEDAGHIIARIVVWSELIIVWGNAAFVVIFIFVIKIAEKNAVRRTASGMMQLVDYLELASGFSILMFLPCPAKFKYWHKHKDRIINDYVTDPPVLRGESLFKFGHFKDRIRHDEAKDIRWWAHLLILPGAILLAFIIQVVIPAYVVLAPFLAFIGFAVKMWDLPAARDMSSWDWTCWIRYVGIINQTSKMWNPSWIETFVAFEIEGLDRERDVRDEFYQGIFVALDRFRGTLLINAMDAPDILQILIKATRKKEYLDTVRGEGPKGGVESGAASTFYDFQRRG